MSDFITVTELAGDLGISRPDFAAFIRVGLQLGIVPKPDQVVATAQLWEQERFFAWLVAAKEARMLMSPEGITGSIEVSN